MLTWVNYQAANFSKLTRLGAENCTHFFSFSPSSKLKQAAKLAKLTNWRKYIEFLLIWFKKQVPITYVCSYGKRIIFKKLWGFAIFLVAYLMPFGVFWICKIVSLISFNPYMGMILWCYFIKIGAVHVNMTTYFKCNVEDCQIVREFCSFALSESFSGGYIDLAQMSLVCLEGSIYF